MAINFKTEIENAKNAILAETKLKNISKQINALLKGEEIEAEKAIAELQYAFSLRTKQIEISRKLAQLQVTVHAMTIRLEEKQKLDPEHVKLVEKLSEEALKLEEEMLKLEELRKKRKIDTQKLVKDIHDKETGVGSKIATEIADSKNLIKILQAALYTHITSASKQKAFVNLNKFTS